MQLPKKYIHDKLMLLLASSNIFLAFLCGVLILLRTGGESTEGYIVEYRSNLGIGAFQTGNALDLLSFAIFAIVIAGLVILLSVNAYRVRRALAVLILSSGALLLVLTVVVSNALMGLQ